MFSFINMYMENKKLFKKLFEHTHIYTCIHTHVCMYVYVSKNNILIISYTKYHI